MISWCKQIFQNSTRIRTTDSGCDSNMNNMNVNCLRHCSTAPTPACTERFRFLQPNNNLSFWHIQKGAGGGNSYISSLCFLVYHPSSAWVRRLPPVHHGKSNLEVSIITRVCPLSTVNWRFCLFLYDILWCPQLYQFKCEFRATQHDCWWCSDCVTPEPIYCRQDKMCVCERERVCVFLDSLGVN